jgi:Glycosyltransferase Family 4
MLDCATTNLNRLTPAALVSEENLKILITNFYLDSYGGTQSVARDLAIWLKRLGHIPFVYSPRLGVVSDEIASHGIFVTDHLEQLTQEPDIIHGQFYRETLRALLHFPLAPAIYAHHGMSFYGDPFYFPRILRYVAVDARCREHLETKTEIPRSRVDTILNFIDLERFQPRQPLPPRPRRALLFSNYAAKHTHLPVVRQACRRMGLSLDVVGDMAGKAVANPESILPRYDLVFAKARCALEATAVGCATVLCDSAGAGPMVTTRNFAELRRLNLGVKALTRPLQPETIIAEVERYDADDARLVSECIRKEGGIADGIHQWTRLYDAVLAESRTFRRDTDGELRAAGAFLETLARWSYESRLEWEREQLERLQDIPVVGRPLHALARRAIKRWKDNAGGPVFRRN